MNFKRITGFALAALLALAGAAHAADSPLQAKSGSITTQNLVPAGACTTGACVETDVGTAGSLTVQVTGTYTASGGLSAQATTNGVNWVTLCATTCSTTFTRATTGATSATIASGVTDVFQVPATGYKRIRITALGAVTGTASITMQPTQLVPSGFASISGGAGDASAANQVTGNASLASIDSKIMTTATASGTITTQNLVPAGTATANSAVAITTSDKGTISAQVTGTYTGALSLQGTTDGTNWVTICSSSCSNAFTRATTGVASATITSGQQDIYTIQAAGYTQVRVTALAAVTGTATVTLRAAPLSSGSTSAGGGGAITAASGSYASGAFSSGSVASGAFASGSIASGAIVDGADVGLGATTDAAATQGSTGSVNAKLRTVTSQLNTGNASLAAIDAGIPAALGATTMSASMPVTISTDDARIGIVTETAPASDTASSGLNGRLQRIAQNLTTLNTSVNASNAQLPTSLGQSTMANSLTTALASNQSAVSLWGHGATGAAVPANVTAMGARAGANSVNVAQGSATVAINVSTATTTQLVALSGSTQIYVTGLAVIAGGTGNITLVYGTGSSCGTGTTSLSGAIPLIANAGFTLGSGLGPVVVVPAGQALCITTSAAVQMSGFVTYTQF